MNRGTHKTACYSHSSNNLELGLPIPDKILTRSYSSTKSYDEKSTRTSDSLMADFRHFSNQRGKTRYSQQIAEFSIFKNSSAKFCSVFDRRKSNAIRRRVHPQLRPKPLSKSSIDFPHLSLSLRLGKKKPQQELGHTTPVIESYKQSGDVKTSIKKEQTRPNYELGEMTPLSGANDSSNQTHEASRDARKAKIRKWVEGTKFRHREEDFSASHLSGQEDGVSGQMEAKSEHVSDESSLYESKAVHNQYVSALTMEQTIDVSKPSEWRSGRPPFLRQVNRFVARVCSDDKLIETTYTSWSTQSQPEIQCIRFNALKDKLNVKGQPLTILNLLEDNQLVEALKMAGEGHSRIRTDVCLLWACSQPNSKMSSILLSNGANPGARDANGFSALHLAAESGCLETVKLLIREGVKLNGPASWDNRGEVTPLMLASKCGHTDIVSLLLQRGADVDAGLHKQSGTALHYAAHSGSSETVQILLDAGATINPTLLYSETPLHIAVEEGYSDVVDILLKAGADFRSSRGHRKFTCLHISARGNSYHITHQLLKAGANPNQLDSLSQTPLHIATRSQCYDIVHILLNYKANPNIQDSEGKTPLHTGIFKGSRDFECLKLLLDAKANPNIPDNMGYTPLHLAALHDSSYCVKLFLKHGADMTHTTKGGVTALSLILKRTPEVLTQIQENLNNAINFADHDRQHEHDSQIQLDFGVLQSGRDGGPECHLLSCFIEEGQKAFIKHPLCETFLFLKWLRVRSFFIFNVAFYIILVLALTHYFYLVFSGTSEYHHQLLGNQTKASQLEKTLHSTHNYSSIKNNESLNQPHFHANFEENCLCLPPDKKVVRISLLYFVWIMLFILTIKEGFQALESPKGYLSSLDNILVWPVICGSYIITVSGFYREAVCPWEYHLAALIILFSWVEVLLLIGRFPTFGLYVHMFTQVTKNFGKFLFAYICLINAFSLSFGILFHNQPPFKHRFVRILKTLVMMTGEIEYNEWFYESKWEERMLYEGTSHLIFAMFLIFGIIILMNLLVGLAVSDIQGLQKSARLDRLVRQTDLIAHFEAFIFSRRLAFLMPRKLLDIIHLRILLLTSMYGSMFILNLKIFSGTNLPSDLMENIKRMAQNRNYLSRRRNAFAEFRTLSNSIYPSGTPEETMGRSIDAIKCGLDFLVWEKEEWQNEMAKLNDKMNIMNTLLLKWTKKHAGDESHISSDESKFTSCESIFDKRKL